MRAPLLWILLIMLIHPVAAQVGTSVLPVRSSFKKAIDDGPGLTEKECSIAAGLYRAMMKTPTYIAAKEALHEFIAKNPPLEQPDDVEEFRQWMTWNLGSTKFKSADEAVRMYKRYMDLYVKQAEENKALYDFIYRATVKQIRKIIEPELSLNRARIKR